jgi:hypothetical protein
MTFVASTIASMLGKDMTLKFKVQQCPIIVIAA